MQTILVILKEVEYIYILYNSAKGVSAKGIITFPGLGTKIIILLASHEYSLVCNKYQFQLQFPIYIHIYIYIYYIYIYLCFQGWC